MPKMEAELASSPSVLRMVVQRLSSQVLLFGLATTVIIAFVAKVLTWPVSWAAGAILGVFLLAVAGYLFIERKQRLEQRESSSLGELMRSKSQQITNQASPMSVQVWTAPATQQLVGSRDVETVPAAARARYQVGDTIWVFFRASQDCYLTLLNLGSSGKMTLLFPNAFHRDNFVAAGRLYRIPDEGADFDFLLKGPAGTERLKAVATLRQVKLLESSFAPGGPVFRTVPPAQGARDIETVQKRVRFLPPEEWTESECEFTVELAEK